MYVCVLVYCVCAWHPEKSEEGILSDPLELALQMLVRHTIQVLGIKSEFSVKATNVLIH